jgi:hypothetical protein
MKFYFALAASSQRPDALAIIEPMLDVGGVASANAVGSIKNIIESPMMAGSVECDDFHEVVALFALVKICRDLKAEEPLINMSDDAGVPVFFDRDEQWRRYLVEQSVISEDRIVEAQDLFVAYGAMMPILDLSTLGLASPVSENDFCM